MISQVLSKNKERNHSSSYQASISADLSNSLVWIKRGICTADSVINIALCCLGYIPGLLHAWYIILKYPDPDSEDEGYEPLTGSSRHRDEEGGRVTYYFVSHQPVPGPRPDKRNYGAFSAAQPTPPQVPSATRPSAQPEASSSSNQPSSDSAPPPTYSEAVRGDNKIQTQD